MMFKILVLQRIYNISDDQTEFQINDRMSFMRFLGLALGETVPDAKTIWNFRSELANAGVIEPLFALFARELETRGIVTHKGTIVDATFVDAPKQQQHP
jgi:IS5 family transposase